MARLAQVHPISPTTTLLSAVALLSSEAPSQEPTLAQVAVPRAGLRTPSRLSELPRASTGGSIGTWRALPDKTPGDPMAVPLAPTIEGCAPRAGALAIPYLMRTRGGRSRSSRPSGQEAERPARDDTADGAGVEPPPVHRAPYLSADWSGYVGSDPGESPVQSLGMTGRHHLMMIT